MPTCTKCGAIAEFGATSCPKCGMAMQGVTDFSHLTNEYAGGAEPSPFAQPSGPDNWIDRQFHQTSTFIIIFAGLFGCCMPILLPLSIAGVLLCRDPIARRNALILFIFHLLWMGLFVFLTMGSVGSATP